MIIINGNRLVHFGKIADIEIRSTTAYLRNPDTKPAKNTDPRLQQTDGGPHFSQKTAAVNRILTFLHHPPHLALIRTTKLSFVVAAQDKTKSV